MTKEEYEIIEYDRIEMIKTINKQYDLENNAYISFSGGKDSIVLHYLIDLALPNNKIPRVFIDTGIEYIDIVKFVKELASKDNRVIIVPPKKSIKEVLEKYGYPFKSKQHSHYLSIYQHGKGECVNRYLGIVESNTIIRCPKQLKYQFTQDFKLKCSEQCCNKLKKEPAKRYEKENNKTIAILGLRQDEGGQRQSHKGCVVFDKDKNVKKFKPLNPISDDFEEWFINKHQIKLCKLYYSPYNFRRTGCKGCPFSLDLQEQLDIMEELLPNEKKQCELIWKPVYEEYRRIGYRLKKEGEYKQLSLLNEYD